MLSLILSWIIQPKNAILTVIILAFLGLFAHDRFLNHEVNLKNEEIISLNKNINELKASIELQNQAIKKMNDDFETQKNEFNKSHEDFIKNNKTKIERIKKQDLYVSPAEIKTTTDEVNQGRDLLKEYLKNRKVEQ